MGIGRKEPGAGAIAFMNITQVDSQPVDADFGAVDVGTLRVTLGTDDASVVSLAGIETAVEVMDDWDESDRAKVNLIAGQAGIAAGSDVIDALTPRVTLATDDAAVVSLAVLDDWDESDRAKVNLIVGQAGIAANAGAVGVTVPRMTLCSDDPAVAHLANVVTSLQIMDDWDAVEDAAVGTDGVINMFEAKSSQKTAMTADGDAVIPVCNLNGEVVMAGHTWATNSLRTEEIDPISQHVIGETLLELTAIPSGTTGYAYFNMTGFRYFTIQGDIGGGPTDTITVTVEGTCQSDGTAPASCSYQDVTVGRFGVANWVDTAFMAESDTVSCYRYVRVKYVTAGGTDDQAIELFVRKLY